MKTTMFLTAALMACVSFCAVACAQSFMGLGDLPGGGFQSFSLGLSADGQVVTGSSDTTSGLEAFRWSEGTGMVGLGVPAGSNTSRGNAISADGDIVIGTHFLPGTARAFEWSAGNGIEDFDPFPAGSLDFLANDVDADGGTIVGDYRPGSQQPNIAYHWSEGVLTPLSASGSASAVSSDGSIVAGTNLLNPNGPFPLIREAFVWSAGDGAMGLGYLPGGSQESFAAGISADGSVVVGRGDSANSSSEAFRWTDSGGMVGLGDLPGGDFDSSAFDTTADGSVVVGTSDALGGNLSSSFDPFIWDETHGMRNLVEVLTNTYGLGSELANWNLTAATAISDNGTVIIGNGINPDGNFEAWRAVMVPEPSTALLGAVTCLGLLLRRTRREA